MTDRRPTILVNGLSNEGYAGSQRNSRSNSASSATQLIDRKAENAGKRSGREVAGNPDAEAGNLDDYVDYDDDNESDTIIMSVKKLTKENSFSSVESEPPKFDNWVD